METRLSGAAASAATRIDNADRLIHIGAPKCGSTALQTSLDHHRHALRTAGLVYVSRGVHWIDAVKAAVGAPDRITGRVPARSAWMEMVAEVAAATPVRGGGPRAILSSEWFSSAHEERVRQIAEDLDPERLHAILIVRPLFNTLPSAWQQALKLGGRQPLSEWLEEALHQPETPRSQRIWLKHRYDQVAARWARVLGADRLTVVVADEREPSFIFRAMEQLVGIPEGTLGATPRRTNPSLSAFEADVLAQLNHRYFDEGGSLRNYRADVLRTFDGYVNGIRTGSVEKSVVPSEHVDAVHTLSRQVADGIASTGCRVIGNLDALRLQPRMERSGSAHTPVAAQRAVDVQSAAGMIYAIMISAGMAELRAPIAGFGGRGSRLRAQARRFARNLRALLKFGRA